MSSLGDKLEGILRPAHRGPAPSVRDLARAAVAEAGSQRAAARAWGVDEKTIRRILKGEVHHPRPSTMEKVDAWERPRGTRRIGLNDLTLTVMERRPARRAGGGGRERTLRAGNLGITDPAAADRIRQAYVVGGKEAAAAQLLNEITVPHYRTFLAPDSARPLVTRGLAVSAQDMGGVAGTGAGRTGVPAGGGVGSGVSAPYDDEYGEYDDPGSDYGYE